MRRPVGIETEYGLNCEGFPEERANPSDYASLPNGRVDFAYEASRIVRTAQIPGAFRGWDYQDEDPYRDLRGMRVDEIDADQPRLRAVGLRSTQTGGHRGRRIDGTGVSSGEALVDRVEDR